MADIYNDTENRIVTGTDSADTIHNNGANNVSISAGAGDDSVLVEGGHNVTVSGGKGNDFVRREWGAGATYIYTGGNDTLENFHDFDSLVIADSWTSVRTDDLTVIITVKNKGTITLTESYLLPTIVSSLKDVKHYNLMFNDGSRTFTGTSGNDYMWNEGNKVKVNGLAGDDYIETNDSQVTIDAGAGDDFVGSWRGSNNLIKLGAGNDIFQAGTGNYTVDGGTGNDTIRTWDEVPNISVNGGDGDDYFHNNAYEATIEGGDGNDFVGNWGSNAHHVKINAGAGDDTIENGSENVTIDGGAGSDTINNWKEGNKTTISGGDDDDFITNYGGSNLSINGGDGSDTIRNEEGWYWNEETRMDEYTVPDNATINGGAGNDNLSNGGSNSSIDGGKGNDYIFSHAGSSNVTINAGTGDDTVRNHSANTFIESGNGDDSIYMHEHMDWNDETQTWDYVSSPDNVTINGGDGDETINNNIYRYRAGENVSINGGKGNDLIYNSGFNATILGGKGNDTVWNNEAGMIYVYKPGEGNDFISGFGTLETLVVDGAKFTTLKSGSDVLVNVGDNTITLQGSASLAKVNIVTSTKGIAPVNVISNYESDVAVNGMVSSNWIRNYADKVTINSGSSTDDIYNSGSNVTIKGGGGYDQIRSYASDVSIQGGSKVDKIISGNGDNVSIDAGKSNDVIDAYDGVNLFIRGGKGNDTINLSRAHGIFTYTKGDGNDVISKGAIINLIDGAKINETITSGSDTVLKIGKGSITVKDSKPEEITVVKNNKYSAYLVNVLHNKVQEKVIGKSSATATQKISNYGEASTIIGGKGIDSIYNEASNSSINAGADDDYLQIGDYNISGVTALGGAGNDTIYNNGKNTSIDAGTGNDTIISEGNSENVTIDGGKGHDVIEVQGIDYLVRGGKGNDTVNLSLGRNNTEYVFEYAKGDGNDVVSKGAIISLIDGAQVDKMTKSGSDTVLKIGSDSITVKNTKPADVEIVTDGNYEEFFGYDEVSNTTPGQIVNFGTSVHRKSRIQNDADNVTIQSGDHSDTINSWGHNVLINAGNGNNYIYSYSTNGTIIAGGGDDSVYTTNNDNDKNYIDLGGGANYIYNNGKNTTIKSNGIEDTIYTCPNSENNLIICGGPTSLDVNGSNSTVQGSKYPDVINFYGDRGAVDSSAQDDIIYNGSAQNYYNEDETVQEQIYTLADGVFKLGAEYVEDYIEVSPLIRAALEQAVTNSLEGIPKEDILAAAEHLKEADKYFDDVNGRADSSNGEILDVLNYVEQLNDAKKLLTDLNEVRFLDNSEEYLKAWGKYTKEKWIFEKDLADYLKVWDDLPESEVRGVLKDWEPKVPDVEYYKTYTKMAQLKEIRNSEASLGNKIKQVGKLINTDTSFTLKAAWKNATKIEKVCLALSAVDVAWNVYDARKEIAQALNVDKNNSLGENLVNIVKNFGDLGNNIKKLNHDKHDNICTSLIDAGGALAGALVGGVATAALVTAGAPVAAAGLLAGVAVTSVIMVGTAALKAGYYKYQYKDNADFWKTFGKNIFGSGYTTKKSTAVKAALSSSETANITTLLGGSGNDTLINDNKNFVTISGGSNNDFLFNQSSEFVTISGGKGKDTLTNVNSPFVTINGDDGNDLISNWANNVEIFGGDGNNTIRNFDSKGVLITALDGKDYIDNAGDGNKIDAGDGNNTVENVGAGVEIQTGTGSDTINNSGTQIKMDTGAGNDSIVTEGDFVTISAGKGNDSLESQDSSNVSVDMGAGEDFLESFGNFSTINTGAGDDIINSVGDVNSINAGTGDDYLENIGNLNSVMGGKGDDYVLNVGEKNLIDAGADNDYIVSFGDNNTLRGGKGSDVLDVEYGNKNVVAYTSGDGNDVVFGFNETSTLSIADGKGTYSEALSDKDMLITVGKGKITLDSAASLSALNINGTDIMSLTLTNDSAAKVTLESPIKTANASSRTSAIRIVGNSLNNSILGGAGADTLQGGKGNDTLWGSAGNDKLYGGAGKDTFIYKPGEGTDTIYDWEAGDLLQILNSDGGQGAFTKSSFKNSKLTLTIDGGGKVVFSNVTSFDAFKINGTTYSISGSKLK